MRVVGSWQKTLWRAGHLVSIGYETYRLAQRYNFPDQTNWRFPVDPGRNGRFDEGFSMRATAQGFGVGLTLARVDKPLKEEAVGC